MTSLVVVDAELDGRPGQAVRIEGGRVVATGPIGAVDRSGADVLDAKGGAVVPGLHDHHLHLLALAARLASVDLDTAGNPAAADATLSAAARALTSTERRTPPDPSSPRWVRAAGYDEHRHGPLDRHRLDALAPDVPVRVQHRSGLSWVLSSAGLRAVGLEPEPGGGPGRRSGSDPRPGVERMADGGATGWLHRLDGWLGEQVGRTAPDLAPVGRRLAGLGITGVTDTTPVLDDGAVALLREAAEVGDLPQRLVLLGRGEAAELDGWARLGPVKVVADEHVGLDVEALTARIADAHAEGRRAAIHCVTRAECVAAVAALLAAGPLPGDRLEHAFTLPPELDATLAAHGIVVVAQPAFVHERGDHYLEAVDPEDVPALHRHASLRAAGVVVALGSDAPVGVVDPWAALRAGSDRRTRSGAVLGATESVPADAALDGYLLDPVDLHAPPRRLAVGGPADLCVLAVPRQALGAATAGPAGTEIVTATVIGGSIVHG